MRNLKQELLGGLAALILGTNAPYINPNQVNPQDYTLQEQGSRQQGDRERYRLLFVEREREYLIDGQGKLHSLPEKASANAKAEMLGGNPTNLTGNRQEMMQHYRRLQKEGYIPDLEYLEKKMVEISDGMTQNSGYLASNGFELRADSDGRNLAISAHKLIKVDEIGSGKDYLVLLNALGIFTDMGIRIDDLTMYHIASRDEQDPIKNGLELRQSRRNFERWYGQKRIDSGILIQQQTYIDGERVYAPYLEKLWENMEKGIKNQQFPEGSVKINLVY